MRAPRGFMWIAEAAEEMECSDSTIRRWGYVGLLTVYDPPRCRTRGQLIKKSEIRRLGDKWIPRSFEWKENQDDRKWNDGAPGGSWYAVRS